MHSHPMQHGPRYLGAAILVAAMVTMFFVGRRLYRSGERKRLVLVLLGYNELLLALFVVGLLTDDGFGWAFLPLMICTAPWSFLAPALAHGPVGGWFASGLAGNFVMLVVLCGGVNSLLLYLIVKGMSSSSAKAPRVSP
jgi:hypothetical protein